MVVALPAAILICVQVSAMPPILSADAPKAAPRDVKVYSPHKKFYAVSFFGPQKTAVFPPTPARTTPRWEIPGYFPVLFLSDDGEHLVVGYPGGNILDADAPPSAPFLTFYEHGRQVARLTIADIFPHLDALPKSTSGTPWGDFWGFEGPTRFGIVLHDDKKLWFDARTGKRLTP